MSDVKTTAKTTAKKGLKILMWIVIFAILFYAIYWVFFLRKVDMDKVKLSISQQSAKYSDPAEFEALILSGVKQIMDNPGVMKQAEQYSKSSGVPIEQVLVDNAIAMAKSFGYIA